MKEITAHLFGNGVSRTSGEHSRELNLIAAILISDLVKNLLGPRGLEKMFVDILGEVTITKDGATLLRKIDVKHPAARLVIEGSNAVDNEVGDGTVSVVVLTGALLRQAKYLLDKGIAPRIIIDGYLRGLRFYLEHIKQLARSFQNNDRCVIRGLIETSLKSKMISSAFDYNEVTRFVMDAVFCVADFEQRRIDFDDVKIEDGIGNMNDTSLIDGIVIDKTIDNDSMPKAVVNAKILLLYGDLESSRTKTEAVIVATSPQQLLEYSRMEKLTISLKVKAIIDSGANVVISRKGISTYAQSQLSKAGIISLRRVKENDIYWLEKATGAHALTDIDFNLISTELLGYAKKVHEKYVGQEKMVIVEGCKNPKAVTILLRAGSKRILDEYHRSILGAMAVARNFVIKPLVVGGGGSSDLLIANWIRKKAFTIEGRQQLVLQKFADALEEIPLTIARNAGMDIVDTLTAIRERLQSNTHPSNKKKMRDWIGIDATRRKVTEVFDRQIIEPVLVKEQIIKTAVEVSTLILGVEDVIMAKQTEFTHTHLDGTRHSHPRGDEKHDHYFDKLGKRQRPGHHYY
jgi:chaperonin GroEL (HSP60 family)